VPKSDPQLDISGWFREEWLNKKCCQEDHTDDRVALHYDGLGAYALVLSGRMVLSWRCISDVCRAKPGATWVTADRFRRKEAQGDLPVFLRSSGAVTTCLTLGHRYDLEVWTSVGVFRDFSGQCGPGSLACTSESWS